MWKVNTKNRTCYYIDCREILRFSSDIKTDISPSEIKTVPTLQANIIKHLTMKILFKHLISAKICYKKYNYSSTPNIENKSLATNFTTSVRYS